MPATLKEWATEQGRDADSLAAELSILLDQEISRDDVQRRWTRVGGAKTWAEALGASLDPPPPPSEGEGAAPRPRRRRRAEAEPPPPPTALLPLDLDQQIAGLYVLVGRGVASGTKDPRYAMVFEQHADRAGKAWADLARQDERVARLFRSLAIGGPWSGVILCHLSLGMSLVMLSGRVSVFPGAPEQPPPPPKPSQNGDAGADAATDTVGQPGAEAGPGVVTG